MQTRLLGGLVLFVALLTTACDEGVAPSSNDVPDPSMAKAPTGTSKVLVALNQRLARERKHVRVPFADYRTAEGTGRVGQRIFAFDRGNKQIGIEFVAGDPRRGGRINITYLVDQSDGATHAVQPAVERRDRARDRPGDEYLGSGALLQAEHRQAARFRRRSGRRRRIVRDRRHRDAVRRHHPRRLVSGRSSSTPWRRPTAAPSFWP